MGLTASSGIGSCARTGRGQRTGLLGAGALVLLAMAAGCSQKFSDTCSETRSCVDESNQGGDGGAGDGVGGTSPGSGGSSGTVGSAGTSGGSSEGCPDGCGEDETCCDGQCVDTTSDSANCGACGHACEGANAEVACVDSQCSIARCEDGYVDCGGDDDGCESEDTGLPGAPAPFLPMAGAYTGAPRSDEALKPKFAWRAPEMEGTCSLLTYEIELTRECVPGKLEECGFEAPDVRESGIEATEWSPSEALPVSEAVPVGALYAWRVRACDAPEHCSAWSRVSYVNVGRLVDDINADGYSDLVGLQGGADVAGVFFSGDGATPLEANTLINEDLTGGAAEGRFLGDVNGDEFPDMLVWQEWEHEVAPRVVLGAASPAGWTSVAMSGPLDARHGGGRAGDLDGDGFADVAISEFKVPEDSGTPPGVVRLYRGRSSFSLSTPVNILAPEGSSPADFGVALEGGFDSNADGKPDLFILDDSDGLIHVLRGSTELHSVIGGSIDSPKLKNLGAGWRSQLLGLGDRNQDGYGDLAVVVHTSGLAENNGTIQVFLGGSELSQDPAVDFTVDASEKFSWAGRGDLGADELADLVIYPRYSFSGSSGYRGHLRALPGSTENQTTSDLVQIANFGEQLDNYSSLAIGDYDGDGAPDLTIDVGGSQRRLFRGGTVGPTLDGCVQPSTSFTRINDWCSVKSSTMTSLHIENAVR
jgi:hypothetical protein